MSALEDPAIPKGSTVLVTGVNGLVGSHVVDKFLEFGYIVRGAVRDTKKNAWVANLFDDKYGKDRFELVSVPDLSAEGAFAEALKGVSAFIHVAAVSEWDPDPSKVIPLVISGVLNAIRAAYAEPSVKRFVLTSSSTAALLPPPDVPGIVVTEETWNEEAVKLAWSLPEGVPMRSGINYAASKTQSEQEIWKFYRENKDKRPDLVVNTVVPCLNFGKSLDIVNLGYSSTSGSIVHLWRGENMEILNFFTPQWFVDVEDVGLLHVAAAIHRDVEGERIFGFGEPSNWDKVLGILRKQNPDRKFIDDFQNGQDLTEIKPRARAEQLLRDLGWPGWTSLEDSVRKNTEGLRAGGPGWTSLGKAKSLGPDRNTSAS